MIVSPQPSLVRVFIRNRVEEQEEEEDKEVILMVGVVYPKKGYP
jgi:hypothetical protein